MEPFITAIFRSKTFWLVLLVIFLTLVYTNSRQAYKANAPVYQSTQGSSEKPATKSDDAPADKSAASDDNTDARKRGPAPKAAAQARRRTGFRNGIPSIMCSRR